MRVKDPAALRRARKNRQYTQRDLAFLVRKSQTAIYALETGRQKTLNEDFAIALAARLGRDWEDLFELEELEPMPNLESGRDSTERMSA
jgi:transcriptional regulator with XRE-family HTH domain